MLPVTHILFVLLYAKLLNFDLFSTLIASVSSLLPDIDFLFRRHRKELHSLLAPLLLSLLLPTQIRAPFFIGYTSHLFLDSANRSGIMLLYPLTKKRVRGPISTGGSDELIISLVLLLLLLIL